uniref:Eukaryotic peptide chain release factor subunit 1 n=1 Tax=Spermophilus dauricus TaxID=99837 RepID=A0A8C9QKI8_SPEDA
MADNPGAAKRILEIWKIKKFIKTLEPARGNGTSMMSLIIPPKDQISGVAKMLADEFGTASNIKSQVNCLSVLGAITSVQQRLKLYNKVPPNASLWLCHQSQSCPTLHRNGISELDECEQTSDVQGHRKLKFRNFEPHDA